MADTNIDLFDQITGLIFSKLYQKFPVAIDISSMDFIESFPDHIDRPGEFFADTVEWLIESGYVVARTKSSYAYTFEDCTLTAKTLEVLKAIPKSVGGESLGGQIASAAKDGATAKLKELVGEALSKGYGLALSTAMNWSN
ncbi:hypothetical protein [Pseudomonas sp. B15(2017)]|uniref:hypothetical protein n=1 Tax=Pseudomonas sp. B15(2017) TaxID=1981744 RepID=UPI000A1E50BB|nr:hypothetical protein [Pseudomonas sp. B15(2017)]